jgi:hypothetical protein
MAFRQKMTRTKQINFLDLLSRMQGKGSGVGNFFVNYETDFDFHQNFAAATAN